MKAIGKIVVFDVGHIDVSDADSLLIAESFVEYMRSKLNGVRVPRSDEDIEQEIIGVIDELGLSPDTDSVMNDPDMVTKMMRKHSRDKLVPLVNPDDDEQISSKIDPQRIPKGCRLSCRDKVQQYLSDRKSCKVQSIVNRFPKFTEDEIKSALGELISERRIRQRNKDEIEVLTCGGS